MDSQSLDGALSLNLLMTPAVSVYATSDLALAT